MEAPATNQETKKLNDKQGNNAEISRRKRKMDAQQLQMLMQMLQTPAPPTTDAQAILNAIQQQQQQLDAMRDAVMANLTASTVASPFYQPSIGMQNPLMQNMLMPKLSPLSTNNLPNNLSNHLPNNLSDLSPSFLQSINSTPQHSDVETKKKKTPKKKNPIPKGQSLKGITIPGLVHIPEPSHVTIQTILEANDQYVSLLKNMMNRGWMEDGAYWIYQQKLQKNLEYLATLADQAARSEIPSKVVDVTPSEVASTHEWVENLPMPKHVPQPAPQPKPSANGPISEFTNLDYVAIAPFHLDKPPVHGRVPTLGYVDDEIVRGKLSGNVDEAASKSKTVIPTSEKDLD
jgi:hypothetical protein